MLDCRTDADVLLDIKDTKSMLIHHVITWGILNTGDEEMPATDFMASSVVRRTLEVINLRAHDGKNNLLFTTPKIDQPFSNAFAIMFDKPLPVSGREQVVIEYDWEEPDRQYVYNFQWPCDNFSIQLIAPKELEIKPVIHESEFSSNPAKTNKPKEWSISGKESGDNYIYEWTMQGIDPPKGYSLLW